MSRLNNPGNNPTVTIKTSDLNDDLKVEKFISLFGRDKYYAAFHDLSEKVHGDGQQQKIMGRMARVDMETEEGMQKYEKLRTAWQKESERRVPIEQASVEVPIGRQTQDRIFSSRDMAKKYLGPARYQTAAGLGGGMDLVNKQNLRKNNQKINEVEKSNESVKGQIKTLEAKLKELKKS